jgi:L-fuculose-phosphate aldolase
MSSDWPLRREIVEIARRVWERGYVAASDGNISARTTGGQLLITASGTTFADLTPDDVVQVTTEGRVIGGRRKPSSEMLLHLEVYRQRSDVSAVVHAHPPIATAFSFAGQSLEECVIPEVVAIFGTIPTTRYATPSTDEGPQVIREFIREHDALILQRHGSLTVGRTLREAYYKLEKLEHSAQVMLAARQLGRVIPMSTDELTRLARVRERLGLGPAEDVFRHCPPRDRT